MHWLRRELRWIPRPAWIVATILGLALLAFGVIVTWQTAGSSSASPGWIVTGFAALVPLACSFVLLIGYIYGDARRRGMRHVLWTLLAIFVPNGVGILIYFLLRQKPQIPCPQCQALLQPGLSFCPNCGSSMGPICQQCHRRTEAGWSHCGHCGAALPA